MIFEYLPRGVCSKKMILDIEGNKIKNLQIIGGCPGNTIGVSKLVQGKDIDEVIELLKGIQCGLKSTSCPDQVSIALTEYKEKILK